MRIIHVDPEPCFSGGEVQVFLLMDGLRARGHECLLACVPGGEPEREAIARGIETRAVPMRHDFDLSAVLRLRGAISEAAADLVHLHTGRANWLGGIAARSLGLPAVTTRRMDRRVKRGWRTRWLYTRLVSRAAAISPAVLKRLLDGGVPVERTRLIWSAVDPSRLKPSRPRSELRVELGCSEAAVVVLAVGALVQRKGFDLLLDALADPAGPQQARLWIAGEGDQHDNLLAHIADKGLETRVRLLGRRSDIPDLLAACDLFAMPSRAEGLGIAALEAMAASRPVVASRVGGLGEVVLDGKTGRLVPPSDVHALATALFELCTDSELRVRFGEAGPERVADGFLPEQMVEAYEQMYREVLAEAREE